MVVPVLLVATSSVDLGMINFCRFKYNTVGNFSLIITYSLNVFSIGLFSRVKSVSDGRCSPLTLSRCVMLLCDKYSFCRLFNPARSFTEWILFLRRFNSTSDFSPVRFSMISIKLLERLRTRSDWSLLRFSILVILFSCRSSTSRFFK